MPEDELDDEEELLLDEVIVPDELLEEAVNPEQRSSTASIPE